MSKARVVRLCAAFVLGVMVPCAGTFWFLNNKVPTQAPPLGAQAPPFEVVAASGDTISSARYEGKRLLLVFVDVDCPACIQELGCIDMLVADGLCNGVDILAVSESGSEGTGRFNSDFALRFPLAMDSGAMRTEYEVEEIPALVLVDETGRVRFRKSGRMRSRRLGRLISEFGREGKIAMEALAGPDNDEDAAPAAARGD